MNPEQPSQYPVKQPPDLRHPHQAPVYAEPPRSQGTNVMAVTSLVSGIASWIFLPVVGAIVAVVCGHLAKSQLRRAPDSGGQVMSTIGLILGYAQIAIGVMGLVLLVIFGVGFFAAINGH